MTGPGEGKIPLRASVYLASGGPRRPLPCTVYLHVKGYSLARVTHIDVEAEELNKVLAPGESCYATLICTGGRLAVALWGPRRCRLEIECRELAEALGPSRSVVYVGGKEGGIFLGFKKEYLRRLEELAERHGVKPR